ncbi:hypothetical protein MXL26_09250 [Acinetobacter towneri]|uniref:hypothetical protein n=1 Tax=Acinetobacter towneri TaxID=202956 RepID=UPI002DBDB9AA|nr:hypothetical protein [Acinetobacter towneri]MEB6565534.1 hypothetical protein [Acinetobacter towneri]
MNSVMTALASIPETAIAIAVYLLGSTIILWCWYAIAKRLPNPLGGITWIMLFAILLTPTVSEGSNAALAPAIFGLLFGVLTKEMPLVWANLSAILFVIGLGLLIGYFWSKYRLKQSTYTAKKKTSPL